MKKVLNFMMIIVCICFCCAIQFQSVFEVDPSREVLTAGMKLPGGGGTTITPPPVEDYYIANLKLGTDVVTKVKDFTKYIHTEFGTISFVAGSTAYDSEKKVVKDKLIGKDDTENFNAYRYDTYTFQKYVDIQIKQLHSRKVDAGEQKSFTIEPTQMDEEFVSTTVTNSMRIYMKYCNTTSMNLGTGVPIDRIEISAGVTNSSTIKTGGELSKTINQTKENRTRYYVGTEKMFLFDNTKSAFDVYFELCFRQKNQIYFTTKYEIMYDVVKKKSGLTTTYTYKEIGYKPVGVYVFLLAVENPYFTLSKYYDNSRGIKEILQESTNNIIYI